MKESCEAAFRYFIICEGNYEGTRSCEEVFSCFVIDKTGYEMGTYTAWIMGKDDLCGINIYWR